MRIPIRLKLIGAISGLIIVLFGLSAWMFVSEKRVELTEDIYRNAMAFARLSAGNVAQFSDTYLAQGSFLYFNREIQSLLEQNRDIGAIQVADYDGNILFDSDLDKEKAYEGEPRAIKDKEFLNQIRSENISFATLDGQDVYIKDWKFVDVEEKPVIEGDKPFVAQMLKQIVVPATERLSVVYKLDYGGLETRIARIRERTIYLALFGILLGMIMAIVVAGQITRPLRQITEAAEKIAKSDFGVRVVIRTNDEIKYLGNAFNQMAQDLGVSVDARIYKERVGRELQLAGEIQKTLVPKNPPKFSGLDIAAGLIPAEEIGGDIYDFLPLDEKRMVMYIGDVTGHGVPAGIVSSIANALLFGYARSEDLKRILFQINKILKAKIMPNMFMTLCMMHWDAGKSAMTYSNAGHELIIHYKAASKKAEFLESKGIALGMIADNSKQLHQAEIKLNKGDVLFAYSDGIPETWKNEKETYGLEKLIRTIERIGNMQSADEISKALFDDVKDFAGGYKQMDDMAMIVIKKT